MKNLVLLLTLFSYLTINAQTYPALTSTPSKILTGTTTNVVFSGGPVNVTNGTCLEVYLQQGTRIIQATFIVYDQASNVLYTIFDLASSTLTGAWDIVFVNWCLGGVQLAKYPAKMAVAKASIQAFVKEYFNFEIFPNPIEAGQDLKILSETIAKSKNSISIFDLTGKMVLYKENIKSISTLKTDALKSGVYFVQSVDEQGNTLTKKLEVK